MQQKQKLIHKAGDALIFRQLCDIEEKCLVSKHLAETWSSENSFQVVN